MSDGSGCARDEADGSPSAAGSSRPLATYCACGLALGLFVASWLPGWWGGERSALGMIPGPVLSRWGALDLVEIWDRGAWWRVLTGAWLHGSWLHLGLNLVGLWSVGRWVEAAVGPGRAAVTLLLSAVVGCLASLAIVEAGLVVGISGGVFGLAGALLSLRLGAEQNSVLFRVSPWELGFWLVLWLGLGAFAPGLLGGDAVIAQGGHIGGLVAGLTCGWLFGGPRTAPVGWARGLGWVALVLGALGLAWLGATPPEDAEVAALRGYRALDDESYVMASLRFGEALELRPEDPEYLNARAYARAEGGFELDAARLDVRRALELVEGGNAALEINMLDTEAWIECRAGRKEIGLRKLARVVELAEREGMDVDVFLEHQARCSEAGG